MDSRTIEEGGQELGGQPLDLPEHTHEKLVNDLDKDREGSTIRWSKTDIPDTPSLNA